MQIDMIDSTCRTLVSTNIKHNTESDENLSQPSKNLAAVKFKEGKRFIPTLFNLWRCVENNYNFELPLSQINLQCETYSQNLPEASIAYFKRLKISVLEETMHTFTSDNFKPFEAVVRGFDDKDTRGFEGFRKITCFVKELPKLNHRFAREAVTIKIESTEFAQKFPRGIFAVTTNVYKTKLTQTRNMGIVEEVDGDQRHAEEVEDGESMDWYDNEEVEAADPGKPLQNLFIEFLLGVNEMRFIQELTSENGMLRVEHICGLTPKERAYDVCVKAPCPVFLADQLLVPKLAKPWPEHQRLPVLCCNLNDFEDGETASVSDLDDSRRNPLIRLHESQRNIVNQMMYFDPGLYFLQGPPGTGKTTTAAAYLVYRVQSPKECSFIYRRAFRAKHSDNEGRKNKILVCAASNKAVRLLMKKTLEYLPPNIKVALVGVGKEIDESLNEVYVDTLPNRICQPMKVFREKTLTFTAQDVSEERLLEIYHQFLLVCEETIRILEEIIYPEDFTSENYEKCFHNVDLFETCVNLLSTLDHMFDVEFRTEENTSEFLLQTTMGKGKQRMPVFRRWCDRWLETITDNGGYVKAHYVTNRAQIVFTTLIASGRRWLQRYCKTFDIVMIDEASQSLVVETLIPLQYNPLVMICIGDQQQLPPVIQSPRCREYGYGESLMSILIQKHHYPFVRLTNQYRMHPSICQFPSRRFYDGQVTTDASIILDREATFQDWKDKVLQSTILPTRFTHIQPSMFFHLHDSREVRQEDCTSLYNPKEAEKILELVVFFLQMQVAPNQIGVITFYAKQVEYFRTLVSQYKAKEDAEWSAWAKQQQEIKHRKGLLAQNKSKRFGPPASPPIPSSQLLPKPIKVATKLAQVEMSTVDSFQGQEKDIVLISMVRTNRSIGFLNEYRRLNVALTRAKYIRWVVGNKGRLLQSIVEYPNHDGEENRHMENEIVQMIEAHKEMNQIMRLNS
jgi:hypothetical protein